MRCSENGACVVAIVACAFAGAAGCKEIYGVDPTGATGRDAGPGSDRPDGATGMPVTVTGTYALLHVDTDASGAPTAVATEPYPALDLTAIAVLADGTQLPVGYDANGAFSFTLPSPQPYQLQVTTPAGRFAYDLDATALVLHEGLLGHAPPPERVTKPTLLSYGVSTTRTDAIGTVATTVGVWTQQEMPAPNGGESTFDWHATTALAGPFGLLTQAAGDRIFIATLSQLTAPAGDTPGVYAALTEAYSDAFDMVDGGGHEHNAIFSPLTPACVRIVHDQAADAGRVLAAMPGGGSDFAYGASAGVVALPAPTLGPLAPLILSTAPTSGVGPIQVSQTQSFGNPLPVPSLAARSVIAYSRSLAAFDGALVSDGITYLAPVTSAPCANVASTTLTAGAALPTALALAGVPLATDGASVSVPAGATAIPLTWRPAAGGDASLTADQYTVTVRALSATSPPSAPMIVVTSTTTMASLPADLFDTSTTYVIEVAAVHGVPGAAHGDFSLLPATALVIGAISSRPFQIVRP